MWPLAYLSKFNRFVDTWFIKVWVLEVALFKHSLRVQPAFKIRQFCVTFAGKIAVNQDYLAMTIINFMSMTKGSKTNHDFILCVIFFFFFGGGWGGFTPSLHLSRMPCPLCGPLPISWNIFICATNATHEGWCVANHFQVNKSKVKVTQII